MIRPNLPSSDCVVRWRRVSGCRRVGEPSRHTSGNRELVHCPRKGASEIKRSRRCRILNVAISQSLTTTHPCDNENQEWILGLMPHLLRLLQIVSP
eukprot:4205239-Pyramimonas_sp.AAC.1